MKKFTSYAMAVLVAGAGLLSSCSEFDPEGMPQVPALETASDVDASVTGRTVTLGWKLPSQQGITGITVYRNNVMALQLPADATSCTLKGQPMDTPLIYTVKISYEGGYVSEGASTQVTVPYIEPKMGYVLLADAPADLPDDDERAAAEWFATQPNAQFVKVADIASLDPDITSVLWIEVDRVGQEYGWDKLPGGLADQTTIDALREYSRNGGSIYLSNMAVQMTVPLGYVSDAMAPTLFGNGAGGTGSDVWVINPYLGVDFKDSEDPDAQGYYDRTAHAIYKDLVLEDPNSYGYLNLPLIGPGQREDHNCMWDCNIYGKGSHRDVIANFEAVTNSLVLATWGHVRDHCVAGLVEFYADANRGHCIANGLAAYEWNQNSGPNIYQHNVEQLTANILNYLK